MVADLISVVIIAIVVQQAVETIKKAVKIKKGYSLFKVINIKVLISIIISVALCVTSEIGILALLNVNALPMIDFVLTGLIVSGGASSIREIQKQIQGAKENNNSQQGGN